MSKRGLLGGESKHALNMSTLEETKSLVPDDTESDDDDMKSGGKKGVDVEVERKTLEELQAKAEERAKKMKARRVRKKRKLTDEQKKAKEKRKLERRKRKQAQAMAKYADIRERRLALEKRRREIELMRKREQEEEKDEEVKDDWKHDAHKEELYTWDMCMVFKVGDPSETVRNRKEGWSMSQERRFKITTARTIDSLHKAGLHTSVYKSVQEDEIFCLIAATENRLEEEADRVDFDLQLDTNEIIEQGTDLDMPLAKHIEAMQRREHGMSMEDWFTLYAPFDRFAPDQAQSRLYHRPLGEGPLHEGSVFRSVDRIKLTMSIIEGDKLVGGAGFSVFQSVEDETHALDDYFPLHQEDKRARLRRKWINWEMTIDQPIHEIRDYFGEKVAIYFAFLTFYCKALAFPAVLGLGFFIWQMVAGRVDVDGIPFFGLFVAFWSSFFLEIWKRKEAVYRVQWGMSNFQDKEQTRPEFRGELKRSPIHGGFERQFSSGARMLRMLLSDAVIFSMICLVISSVWGIMVLRKVLTDWDEVNGGILAGIINAIQIQLMNMLYGEIAVALNDYENYRTHTEYENGLIAKAFLFKFVNSYNSLFYIAFFKRYDEQVGFCKDDDCLGELQIQLGTIFIAMISFNNLIEIGTPMFKNWKSARDNAAVQESADGLLEEKQKSSAERDYDLEEYESTFDDFDELAIQYGFVSLFVVAFPLAPLMAFINNYLEIRLDATKVCNLTKRPEPMGAYDIGTWYDVFAMISFVSVVTNCAIIAFEVEIVRDWSDKSDKSQVAVFVILEHFILAVKFAIDYFMPDEPEGVSLHLQRQSFLSDVLIKGIDEENERAIAMEEAAKGMTYAEEKGEEIEIGGVKENEWWMRVERAVPDALHLWEMNRLDKVKGRTKWALAGDESEEWEHAEDDRMALNLLLPMDRKVRDGGFVLQPPEFWMMYDLYYLGTVYATQYVYLNFSGNDVMDESRILAKLMQLGGVPGLAFKTKDFHNYLKWWLDRRRPKWAIYLDVKPDQVNDKWLGKQLDLLDGLLNWRFELVLSRDGIIVKPEPA